MIPTRIPKNKQAYDVIVIGGGFYGCSLALFLKNKFERVAILEKETDLLTRASYANQARVHQGYHYPRSIITALRSCLNFPRFVLDFRQCIDDSFDKVYAIARRNSKITAFQFKRLMAIIGAPLKPAPQSITRLFNPDLIEKVFLAREYAFDAVKLRNLFKQRLKDASIDIWYRTEVDHVVEAGNKIQLILTNGESLAAQHVFNCTYSQINTLLHRSNLPLLPLKHEVTEIALIEVPSELKNLGVTVMDGPFFSTMPFPARGLHSLSHVRYTPHEQWFDQERYQNAHAYLTKKHPHSNAILMLKDAQRYLPALTRAKYIDSLFEIKTVLTQNEVDDGRPILLRTNYGLKNFSIIMGGKIDNVYDVLQALNGLHQYAHETADSIVESKKTNGMRHGS